MNEDIEKLNEILSGVDILSSINDNFDTLLKLIPEIEYIIGFLHNHPHHHLDVWFHTLYALSLSPNDFDIRLSLLLHDIGKPFSYQDDGNIRHFYNHPKVSASISRKILKRIGFSENYIAKIIYLIREHDSPITKNDVIKNYDLELKRYEIQKCDVLAHNPEMLEKRKKYLKKVKRYFND